MTEQVLKVLGKLDERNSRSIIWVTLEQAKLIIYLALLVKHHKCFQFPYLLNNLISQQRLYKMLLTKRTAKYGEREMVTTKLNKTITING